jgi:hypothetical protein
MNLRELSAKWNIPLVQAREINGASISEVVDAIREMDGIEGFVIRFQDTGLMYKSKCDSYVAMHKAKDNINFEKNVLAMIISEKVDDVLPLLFGDDRTNLIKFNDAVNHAIAETAERLFWIAQASHDNFNGSAKRFALEVVEQHKKQGERGILFTCFNNIEKGVEGALDAVKSIIQTNLSTQTKVENVRHLFGGLRWADYAMARETED